MATIKQTFTDIADAIRQKSESEDKYKPEEMPAAIKSIHSTNPLEGLEDARYFFYKDIRRDKMVEWLTPNALSSTKLIDYFFAYDVVFSFPLSTFPSVDWSNVESISYFFRGRRAENMDMGILNFEKAKHASSAFYSSSPRSIESLHIPSVTNADQVFYNCHIQSIGEIVTSDLLTACSGTFYGADKLQYIPSFNTSSCKIMYQTFNRCSSLKELPKLNYEKVNSFYGFAQHCTSLTHIDAAGMFSYVPTGYSDRINTEYCFDHCTNLVTVDNLDTKNLISISYLFNYCSALKSITSTLDFSHITSFNNGFYNCTSLEDIAFVNGSISVSISFGQSPLLSDASIQSIIDGLAEVTSAKTLTLHADVKAKLTEEQIAEANTKGWTIA